METRDMEKEIRNFQITGNFWQNFCLKTWWELLDFAQVFYPKVYDELIEYDYFGSYHY